MQLANGAMVTPTVRLVRPLRSGGMGHVWLAEHIGLHVNVAVKFIADKLSLDDPAVRASFEQEARTAALIKSENVVQTHDCGIMADGTPYIVMELLEGESLQDRLDRERVLPLADTVRIVGQVARALGRAHRLGIVHRDVKPANLFLCPTDEGLLVKVLDFGLAQLVRRPDAPPPSARAADLERAAAEAHRSEAELMVGTLPFLRPETLAGEQRESHHADLWALAVVTYRCLVGRFPFTGNTPGLLCLSVMTGEFPAPSELRPELPRAVDEWFVRAFHGEQERRFQSAKELAIALASVAPGALPYGLLDDDSKNLANFQAFALLRAASAGGTVSLESGATVLPAMGDRTRTRSWWALALGLVLLSGAVAVVAGLAMVGGSSSSGSTEGAGPANEPPSASSMPAGDPPAGADSAVRSASAEGSFADAGSAVNLAADEQDDGGAAAVRSSAAPLTAPAATTPPGGRPARSRSGAREDYGF